MTDMKKLVEGQQRHSLYNAIRLREIMSLTKDDPEIGLTSYVAGTMGPLLSGVLDNMPEDAQRLILDEVHRLIEVQYKSLKERGNVD
jgi:hypothetical protein